MNLFWENILRYPKFLITSMSGLFIIVFGNIFNLMKKNQKSKFITLFITFLIFTFLLIIFFQMLDL